MTVSATLMRVANVILQYGVLLFLFLFVARMARMMWRDTRREFASLKKVETPEAEVAALFVLQDAGGTLEGQRFAFQQGITIGRDPTSGIAIADAFVSHHHARVYLLQNQYVLEDLGSRNHTYVNGKPLTGRTYLKVGDQIQIGRVLFQFER